MITCCSCARCLQAPAVTNLCNEILKKIRIEEIEKNWFATNRHLIPTSQSMAILVYQKTLKLSDGSKDKVQKNQNYERYMLQMSLQLLSEMVAVCFLVWPLALQL